MSQFSGWASPWAPDPTLNHAAWGSPVLPRRKTHLPTQPREYHEFWRRSFDRWWKWVLWVLATLAAAALTLAAYLLLPGQLIVAVGMFIDRANGIAPGSEGVTPALFIANDIAVACFIPAALLFGWAASGQRPRFMTSIVGGMRWRWLLKSVLVIAPIWLLTMGALQVLDVVSAAPGELRTTAATVPMLLAVLFLTPLQAAGEEYALRGMVTRVVGSWIPHRYVGLVVSALASAVLFTYLHNAQDPWLNTFYFCFALTASYLTWRTGGLEAAIVMHTVNNMISEMTLPWVDFSNLFDRSDGTGSPWGLIQVVLCVLAIVAVELAARFGKVRPRNVAAPGDPVVDERLRAAFDAKRAPKPTLVSAGLPGAAQGLPGYQADPYGPAGYGTDPYGRPLPPQPAGTQAGYAPPPVGPYAQPPQRTPQGGPAQPTPEPRDPYAGRHPWDQVDPPA